jgi:hypothetical protein
MITAVALLPTSAYGQETDPEAPPQGNLAQPTDTPNPLTHDGKSRRIYKEDTGAVEKVHFAAVVAISSAASTLIYLLCFLKRYRNFLYVLILLWAFGPPVWFWYEYFFIFLVDGEIDSLDLLQHGQQTAAAIWAGMLAFLGGVAAATKDSANEQADVIRAQKTIQDAVISSISSKKTVALPQSVLNAYLEHLKEREIVDCKDGKWFLK